MSSSYVPDVPVQVKFWHTYGQIYVYIHGGPAEIQTASQCKPIGSVTTVPRPPVLPLNNILPLPSSHCVFHFRTKNFGPLITFFLNFLCFTNNCVNRNCVIWNCVLRGAHTKRTEPPILSRSAVTVLFPYFILQKPETFLSVINTVVYVIINIYIIQQITIQRLKIIHGI